VPVGRETCGAGTRLETTGVYGAIPLEGRLKSARSSGGAQQKESRLGGKGSGSCTRIILSQVAGYFASPAMGEGSY
jgi:hypothetical protein